MNLGNILQRAGGIAETGRESSFQLRYRTKSGEWHRREVKGVLLPVGEAERQQALGEADAHCDEKKWTAADIRTAERWIRILAASLHQPGNLRARLVPESELHLLRAGLVHIQLDQLAEEYGQLLLGEYPELFTAKDAERVEEAAEGFSEPESASP